MNKNDILDYVTKTPSNSNRAVLGGMLDSIDGGSSLPEVTSEDNGKVLTVVDGTWNKAEASGGDAGPGAANGVFVIRTTDYDSDEGLWETVDKTYAEVLEAIKKGQLPVIYVADGNLVDNVLYYHGNNYYHIDFFAISSGQTPSILRYEMDSDGHFTRL